MKTTGLMLAVTQGFYELFLNSVQHRYIRGIRKLLTLAINKLKILKILKYFCNRLFMVSSTRCI